MKIPFLPHLSRILSILFIKRSKNLFLLFSIYFLTHYCGQLQNYSDICTSFFTPRQIYEIVNKNIIEAHKSYFASLSNYVLDEEQISQSYQMLLKSLEFYEAENSSEFQVVIEILPVLKKIEQFFNENLFKINENFKIILLKVRNEIENITSSAEKIKNESVIFRQFERGILEKINNTCNKIDQLLCHLNTIQQQKNNFKQENTSNCKKITNNFVATIKKRLKNILVNKLDLKELEKLLKRKLLDMKKHNVTNELISHAETLLNLVKSPKITKKNIKNIGSVYNAIEEANSKNIISFKICRKAIEEMITNIKNIIKNKEKIFKEWFVNMEAKKDTMILKIDRETEQIVKHVSEKTSMIMKEEIAHLITEHKIITPEEKDVFSISKKIKNSLKSSSKKNEAFKSLHVLIKEKIEYAIYEIFEWDIKQPENNEKPSTKKPKDIIIKATNMAFDDIIKTEELGEIAILTVKKFKNYIFEYYDEKYETKTKVYNEKFDILKNFQTEIEFIFSKIQNSNQIEKLHYRKGVSDIKIHCKKTVNILRKEKKSRLCKKALFICLFALVLHTWFLIHEYNIFRFKITY